ncbi:MAG: hypothetical protein GY769_14325 [bacterium]|nr:hypothetical protein [bacterium]
MTKDQEAHSRLKSYSTSVTLKGQRRLTTFLENAEESLSKKQRPEHLELIIAQALVLFGQLYANLPLKEALHAANPVGQLRRLQRHVKYGLAPPDPLDFHRGMTEIFVGVRDRHMTYYWPEMFRGRYAWLGCEVEECWEPLATDGGATEDPRALGGILIPERQAGRKRKYILARIHPELRRAASGFVEGAELTHWNGTPIHRAIQLHADRLPGSNAEARHAFGLARFCYAPLSSSPPPDEHWVRIRYLRADENGEVSEGAGRGTRTLRWRVAAFKTSEAVSHAEEQAAAPDDVAPSIDLTNAIDEQGESIRRIRVEVLDVPEEVERKKTIFKTSLLAENSDFPISYLRLFSFASEEIRTVLEEIREAVHSLGGTSGLVVDIRDNPGGSIKLAELLLQGLRDKRRYPTRSDYGLREEKLERSRFQFRPSDLVRNLIERAPERINKWRDWEASVDRGLLTGEQYSAALPITTGKFDVAEQDAQIFYGPLLLITNARTYSAADMFAAGFQDNELGLVLGTDDNTGAGGANMVTHQELFEVGDEVAKAGGNDPFEELPLGVGMSVAIRRALRVGDRAGAPLEDLGVRRDVRHFMTKNDLLHENVALKRHAVELLSSKTEMAVESVKLDPWTLRITARVRALDAIKKGELRYDLLTQDDKELKLPYKDPVFLRTCHATDPVRIEGSDTSESATYRVEIVDLPQNPCAAGIVVRAMRDGEPITGCVLLRPSASTEA